MPVDPAHGRNIPAGRAIARATRATFVRQKSEVVQRIRLAPDLSILRFNFDRWIPAMIEICEPFVRQELIAGAQDGARRLASMVKPTPPKAWNLFRVRRKDTPTPPVGIGWDIYNPLVSEFIRTETFHFVNSVNETTADKLREALQVGLEAGDPLKALSEAIAKWFAPSRAALIGITEASRAMHGGQVMNAKASNVVQELEWLASADACPVCLALAGTRVAVGANFAVDGYGPYAQIPHPPRHPG